MTFLRKRGAPDGSGAIRSRFSRIGERTLAVIAALALVCALLSSCALLEAVGIGFAPEDGEKKATPDGKIAVTNVTPGTLLDYFSDVAIGSEYGESAEIVCKWTKTVRYYVAGEPTKEDFDLLGRLCERLNEIDGFPGIYETSFKTSADLTVYFVSREELIGMFQNADESCSGMASYEWESGTGRIISAKCAIDRELTADRACTTCEEFLQALGPARDSYMFPNSVFYQGMTLTPFPLDLDFAVMELLYSPSLPAGTPRVDAMSIAATLVKWK